MGKGEEEEETPKVAKKGNCFSRAFFCLWPNEQKPYFTEEGQRMRTAMTATTVIHCLLFILSLTLIGFFPMLYNLILAAWSYSCQLTLR